MEGAWGGVWLPIRSADWRLWAGSGGVLGVAGVSRNAMPTPGRVLSTRKSKRRSAATCGYSFRIRTPTRKYFATKLRLPEVGYRPEYDFPENFRSSLRPGPALATLAAGMAGSVPTGVPAGGPREQGAGNGEQGTENGYQKTKRSRLLESKSWVSDPILGYRNRQAAQI